MKNFVTLFIAQAQKGVSALEYAILIGVVVVGVAAAVGFLAEDVVNQVETSAAGVGTAVTSATTKATTAADGM